MHFVGGTFERSSDHVSMLQAGSPDMESDVEVIIPDCPRTFGIAALALTQAGQDHRNAEDSQAVTQDGRFEVLVAERTDIVVFAFEKAIQPFALCLAELHPGRRAVQEDAGVQHTLADSIHISGGDRRIVGRGQPAVFAASGNLIHQHTAEKAVLGRGDQAGQYGGSAAPQHRKVGMLGQKRTVHLGRTADRLVVRRLIEDIPVIAEILRYHVGDRFHLRLEHTGGVGSVVLKQFDETGLGDTARHAQVLLLHDSRFFGRRSGRAGGTVVSLGQAVVFVFFLLRFIFLDITARVVKVG